MPCTAKTTCKRGGERENTYSVIRDVVPRGHSEHGSATLASLSWDVAALSLIQSWETDRHVEGQSEGRMEEDLERKLLCWGVAEREGCVCSLLHAGVLPSTGVMKAQHRSELSCLNHKSLSYCSSENKYRSRTLPFAVSWVFVIVHEHVWL